MWDTMFNFMNGTIAAMGRAQQASLAAATRSMELAASTYARLWGMPAKEVVPEDRRFEDDDWRENLPASVLKQYYLIASQWMAGVADSLEEVNPDLHHRAKFWTQQCADVLSPTNNPFTNPAVMRETIRTSGSNLVRGAYHLASDLLNGRIAQVPPNAFELGKDLAVTPGQVIYRSPLIELIQYTPTTETVHSVPILMIPPWINKYYVMDMEPEESMCKFLVNSGFTVFMLSWKNPDKSILHLEWDDYIEQGPLDALRVIRAITGAEKVNAVGYCLGGIALQTALGYLAALGKDELVNTATFFATHQDFSDAGDVSVFIDEPQVRFLEWLMDASGGYLDGRNIALTFNILRANDLFWRFVINNYLMGKEPPHFALLYWNGDSTRVPGRVHTYLVREFFLKNKLMEPGGIQVKGVGIDLGRITTPTYAVAATGDHIVPWRGAYKIRQLMGGPVRFVLTEGGHIAGVVNPPGRSRKRAYWINECETCGPEEWLAGATKHLDSWWTNWAPWLAERSGAQVAPPPMGSAEFSPIMDAPGAYVLEK